MNPRLDVELYQFYFTNPCNNESLAGDFLDNLFLETPTDAARDPRLQDLSRLLSMDKKIYDSVMSLLAEKDAHIAA